MWNVKIYDIFQYSVQIASTFFCTVIYHRFFVFVGKASIFDNGNIIIFLKRRDHLKYALLDIDNLVD